QGPAQDFNQGQNFGQAPQQDFNQGPAQDFNQGQNFGQAPQQDFNPLANQGGGNNFDQQPANQGDNFSNPFAGFDTPAQPNPNMSQPMQQPQPTPDMNTGFDPNVFQDEEEEKPKKNKSLLLVLLLLIVIAVGFGAYIYFFVFNAPSKAPATTPTTSITTTTKSPKPFLNLNSAISSDMQISLHNSDLVKDHIQEKALENLEEAGTIKIIEPTIKNQYLNNLEVLTSLVDNVPENLLQSLGEQYILYTYYGEERPTLGLILSLKPNTTEIVSKIMTE
ncbi:MAG: hypothetical protein PHO23_03360, partial [Candidatus Pacebacteria bacterium]|nr:hypothetical protein [Candidatus Paceibacterota bacterium]